MKNKYLVGVFLLLILFVPLAAGAVGSMDENIFITREQIIDYNYWRLAGTLDISGTMKKDVVALAESVVIDGVIEGDLIGAANTLIINGEVKGNVRFVAESIKINGIVGKNLLTASSYLEVNKPVGWGITAAANDFILNSEQPADVNFYGQNAQIKNNIGGNLFLNTGENGQVAFSDDIQVGGDFEYSPTKQSMENFDKVLVAGQSKQLESNRGQGLLGAEWNYIYLYSRLIYFFGLLLIGYICLSFLPRLTGALAEIVSAKPLICFNRGFWWLILTPLACLVAALTIIGLPLSMIVAGLYVIAFYISKVFAGLAIGLYLFKKQEQGKNKFWPMFLGLFIVVVLISLPFVGFLFSLIVGTMGMGAVYLLIRKPVK